MGISYEVMFADKGCIPRHNDACWSRVSHVLSRYDNLHQRECLPEFHIRLALEEGTAYFENTDRRDRKLSDKVFDLMFTDWLGDWAVYEYADGKREPRTGIIYSPDTPQWVIIASASVYRMHYDMSNFFHNWREIGKAAKLHKRPLNPWVHYFMVVNICNYRNTSVNWYREKTPVVLESTTNHMPIDGNYVDVADMQYVAGWTKELFEKGNDMDRKPLRSIYREYIDENTLTYRGRDKFFTGRTEGLTNWMIEEAENAGILIEVSAQEDNPYASKVNKVCLHEFFEKVIVKYNM